VHAQSVSRSERRLGFMSLPKRCLILFSVISGGGIRG
jgi:hypothetical protein